MNRIFVFLATVTAKHITSIRQSNNKWWLTGQTHRADVSNVNQCPMTKARGAIVDFHPRRQSQLGPCCSVRQKYPLNKRFILTLVYWNKTTQNG